MQRSLSAVEYSRDEEVLAGMAKALSHPVRVKILKLLSGVLRKICNGLHGSESGNAMGM
ncbi:hypothetical protein [Chlorobium sp.]|uniref:hypothetical protein n=1 Tax=Chlorobium sp. TaxID=1095 RepID=UPI003C6EA858